MTRVLHRRGRLTVTLLVITTVSCILVEHHCRSFSHTFAVTGCWGAIAVGAAMLIDEYQPIRRIRR